MNFNQHIMGKDTVILLNVDPCDLKRYTFVNMTTSGSGSGEGFNAEVNPGKKVIWIGGFMDSEKCEPSSADFVNIIAVVKKGGANLLKKEVYYGNGTITAHIKDWKESAVIKEKEQEEYFITYCAQYQGNYMLKTIDPMLELHKK